MLPLFDQTTLALVERSNGPRRLPAKPFALPDFVSQTGGAPFNFRHHRRQDRAHVDQFVERPRLDQGQRGRLAGHHLQRGGQPDHRPLLLRQPRALALLQLVDDRDTGARGLDIGFRCLDAGSERGGLAGDAVGIIAGRFRLAQQGIAALTGALGLLARRQQAALLFGQARSGALRGQQGCAGRRQTDKSKNRESGANHPPHPSR